MEDKKTILVFAFNERKNGHRIWSKHILSVAKGRGYKEILMGKKLKIPKHFKILTDAEKKCPMLR